MSKDNIRRALSFLLTNLVLVILVRASYGSTLREYIDAAINNSYIITSLSDKIEAARYAYKKDQGALYPQFAFNESHDSTRDNSGLAVLKATLDIQKMAADFPRSNFVVLQKILVDREIATNDLVKTVSQDYYLLFVTLQKKKDYTDAKAYFEKHIKDIEKLSAQGVDVRLDLQRARIKYGALSIAVNEADSALKSILIELSSLTKKSLSEADFSAMDVPGVHLERTYFENQKQELLSALPQTRQYRSRMFELDLANQLYRQTRLPYLPSLGLEFDRAYNNLPGGENYNYVTLDFPLFDGLQRLNDRRRLKSEYEAQKKLFEENLRQLRVRGEQLVSELENIQTRYTVALNNVSEAGKLIEISSSLYRMGKIKETDLLEIFSGYLDAKQQYYDALNNFLNRQAELEYILSGIPK